MNKITQMITSTALVLVAVFSFAVVTPSPVNAALSDASKAAACRGAYAGGNCDANSAGTKIQNTIKKIIDLLTVIIGIAAVIAIIINGLRFITANGDSNSIGSARSGILYALVGLVIVALAQVIVRFVLTKV